MEHAVGLQTPQTVHIIVMGVSGCGKSSVANTLSQSFGWEMAEGDEFHPETNIEKMSHGIPLTDTDREPWLHSLYHWSLEHDKRHQSTVMACSALKRSYRTILAGDLTTFFIHLSGPQNLISARLNHRQGHFMPADLLPSQYAALEPLTQDENGATLSVAGSFEDISQQAISLTEAFLSKLKTDSATR